MIHSLVFSPWPVWQEPEFSQVTGMALARCILRKFLRGRLPLLSPVFRRSHFCRQMPPRGRIMSTKNSKDTIGNRTHDFPACSAVPQPTAVNKYHIMGVRGGTALQGRMSQVPFPVVSLGFFHCHPSGRTLAPESAQPLTEMSTRNISWG